MSPEETTQRSKAGLYDHSLLLDSSYAPWPGDLLLTLRARAQPGAVLFPFSYSTARNHWVKAVSAAGLGQFSYVMYQLRHGGASWDTLKHFRTRREVKARGDWMSDASLLRYDNAARVQQMEGAVPAGVQMQAQQAVSQLPAALRSALSQQRAPPRPASSRSSSSAGALRSGTPCGPSATLPSATTFATAPMVTSYSRKLKRSL